MSSLVRVRAGAGYTVGGESAIISGPDTGKSVEKGPMLFQRFQLGPGAGGDRVCGQSAVNGAQRPREGKITGTCRV